MKKTTFYILSHTWGILMTLVGYIVALVLLIVGIKPTRYGTCLCFKVGHVWGGCSLGTVVLCSQEDYTDKLLAHELGHAIQNCLFGPLMVILVSLPSAIRYQYRNLLIKCGRTEEELPPYDSAWFEGQATAWGKAATERWSIPTVSRKR